MDKPYVGFWWRFLAAIIDGIIMMVFFYILSLVFGISMMGGSVDPATGMPVINPVSYLLQFVIPIAYYGVMQASAMQATVGKMAIGAIVTDVQGNRLSYAKSFLREVCKIPAMMILLIGYIMIAFTARKQGLHDIMAGTLVVKKKMADQMVGASA